MRIFFPAAFRVVARVRLKIMRGAPKRRESKSWLATA